MIEQNGKIYFTEKELRCKGSGNLRLAPGFGEKLLELRLAYNRPMIVNSCCRSKEHNFNVGGNPRSFHVSDLPFYPTGGCCAIDIDCDDSFSRANLVACGLSLGWWVGVHKSFIHFDRRVDYGISPAPGIFLY